MFPIRMQKLACTDQDKINHFLTAAQTGYLGLSSDNLPYVIPLNFVWWKDAVYFHGAAEGRKASVIQQNAQACFTVSEAYGTISSPVPAHTDTAYMSVMIFGLVKPAHDLNEATAVMQGMLDKYVPGYYDKPLPKSHLEKYIFSLGSKTVVYKLTPTSLTAKENERKEGSMFFPGRTAAGD